MKQNRFISGKDFSKIENKRAYLNLANEYINAVENYNNFLNRM